jgi:DNA uptake protein ComE-like DNA-binding protein
MQTAIHPAAIKAAANSNATAHPATRPAITNAVISAAAHAVNSTSYTRGTNRSTSNLIPNTISPDSLCLLGFSEKQALTIIHYREKGGIFRRKEDFKKMYVVDDARYIELLPYITIPQGNTADKSEKKHHSKNQME